MHSNEEQKIIELARQHGSNASDEDLRAMWSACKAQGVSIDGLMAMIEDSALTDAIENEGIHNQDFDVQDAKAQKKISNAKRADALGTTTDGKLTGSVEKSKKQFGNYMKQWLDAMATRLNLEPKSQELYEAFLEGTGLTRHISIDDVAALSTQDNEGIYHAMPSSHLLDYLVIEVHRSEDVSFYRQHFRNAGLDTEADSDRLIDLDVAVSPRHVLPLETLMCKAILNRTMARQNVIMQDVANQSGLDASTISNYLSPVFNAVPVADKTLLAFAGGDESNKHLLDQFAHNYVLYPDGINSMKQLVKAVHQKAGLYPQSEMLTLGVDNFAHSHNQGFKTRDLILIKSWLSEHIADNRYAHIGVTDDTLNQWSLEGIPTISPARLEQDVVSACKTVDYPEGFNNLHDIMTFVKHAEGRTILDIGGELNITNIIQKINPTHKTKFSKDEALRLEDWLIKTFETDKYTNAEMPNSSVINQLVKEKTAGYKKPSTSDEVKKLFHEKYAGELNTPHKLVRFIAAVERKSMEKLGLMLKIDKLSDKVNPKHVSKLSIDEAINLSDYVVNILQNERYHDINKPSEEEVKRLICSELSSSQARPLNKEEVELFYASLDDQPTENLPKLLKFLSASDGKSVTELGEGLGEKDLASTANPKLSRKFSHEVATNLKAYINDSFTQARFENIPKPSVQQISDWVDEQTNSRITSSNAHIHGKSPAVQRKKE